MNPLIFFGLTIILLIIAIVLYFVLDVKNEYVYWILGGLASVSFITTLTIFALRPSQRQLKEQEFARKQKNIRLNERNKYKTNRSVVLKGTKKPLPLTPMQIRHKEQGFYNPDAEYPIQDKYIRKYLRNIKRR